jgi:transposase InsO family protein
MKLAATYPIRFLCKLLELPRSCYYYVVHPRDDTALEEQIRTISGTWPTYGVRRVTAQVRRDYQVVNRKRIRRVMRKMHLTRKNKRKTRRTTQSNHPFPRYPNLVVDLVIAHPDQVWVADVTYVQLQVECVYLAVLMDVFTRAIRGWHLSHSLDHDLTLTALRYALSTHCPEIHHSDQGLQYAATGYGDLLNSRYIAISMAEAGEATQNGYAERLIRTIKEEEVNLSEYRDYADAFEHLGRFLDDVYQHKRIHSALGYLTPAEFEQQWRAQQTTTSGVH